jgi:HAD superfamily hydrolase (TIGR01509 family)
VFAAMSAAQLEAVIFDVDGTLAETERHGHRVAFNRAMEHKGLPDRWSDEMYRDLLKTTGGVRRLTHYFVDYKGWDNQKAAALAKELHKVKTGLFLEVVRAGEVPARIGVLRFIKELQEAEIPVAVATTGTASWVHPLLDHLRREGGLGPFAVVVTGDLVENLKPAPDAFLLALEKLSLTPEQVVIIEDSRNGVKAAIAAGSPCLAVKGEYAKTTDLEGADLVVDEFGEPEKPLEVLHNPLGIEVGPMLTPKVVEDLHRKRAER